MSDNVAGRSAARQKPGAKAGAPLTRAKKRWSCRAWSWACSSRFGSGAQDVVPVAALDWRAKPGEWDPEFFAKRSVAVYEAVARSIGVCSAAEKRAGQH